MRSPILALTGPVWRRHRWGFAACTAVWLAYVGVALLATTYPWPVLGWAYLLSAPVALATMLFVVCAVSFNDGRAIAARESTFQRSAFLLPLSTPTLVFWPMAQASASAAAVWVAWVVGVAWPTPYELPVIWPALVAANAVAWLQATSWSPFPTPGLRLAAVMLCVGGVGIISAVPIAKGAPPVAVVGTLAALLPAAYGVALYGVRRARRGDTPHWRWPGRVTRWLSDRLAGRRTGFASPVEAQAWFEWRLRGWALPVVAGIGLPAWLAAFTLWDGAMQNVLSDEMTPTLTAVVGRLSPPGGLLVGTLACLPLYAEALGTDLGGVRFVGRRVSTAAEGFHPLLGLKPLTAREFVLAKWRMALRATLWAWAVVLLPAVATYTVAGKWAVVAAAPAWTGYGPAGTAFVLVALVAWVVVATWVQLVGGLWAGLWGNGWLTGVAGLLVALAWLPLGYAVYWLGTHPDGREWLPTIACAAVAMKSLLAGLLARAVVRGGHATAGELALAAVAWVAFAAGCVALVLTLVSPERASLAAVALGVAVLLPFNRIVAAPLLLAQNRHG